MERLPELMADALAGRPEVLITVSTPGALAAKKATSTVPIVVAAMGDPVQTGVVIKPCPTRGQPDSDLHRVCRRLRRESGWSCCWKYDPRQRA